MQLCLKYTLSSSYLLKYMFDKMSEMSPLSPLIELSPHRQNVYWKAHVMILCPLWHKTHLFPGRKKTKKTSLIFSKLYVRWFVPLWRRHIYTEFCKDTTHSPNAFILYFLLFCQLRCILSLIYFNKWGKKQELSVPVSCAGTMDVK